MCAVPQVHCARALGCRQGHRAPRARLICLDSAVEGEPSSWRRLANASCAAAALLQSPLAAQKSASTCRGRHPRIRSPKLHRLCSVTVGSCAPTAQLHTSVPNEQMRAMGKGMVPPQPNADEQNQLLGAQRILTWYGCGLALSCAFSARCCRMRIASCSSGTACALHCSHPQLPTSFLCCTESPCNDAQSLARRWCPDLPSIRLRFYGRRKRQACEHGEGSSLTQRVHQAPQAVQAPLWHRVSIQCSVRLL